MGHDLQLAIKLVRDPGHFDFEKWQEIRGACEYDLCQIEEVAEDFKKSLPAMAPRKGLVF